MFDKMKIALNEIEYDLRQKDCDGAFAVLNDLVCHAIREGYKAAVADLAIWHDGNQHVGVLQEPLAKVLNEVDKSIVNIGKPVTLVR